MRVFRVQIGGESYTVSVEETGKDQFRAVLDNVTFEMDATSNGDVTTWLVRSISDSVHGQAKTLPNDRVDVWLACVPFPAVVQAVGIGGYAVVPEERKVVFGGRVKALMPGRITSILVKEGDVIKEGASLLILEAMKMQNEITSPTDGRIKTIYVKEGDSVKKDEVLVLFG